METNTSPKPAPAFAVTPAACANAVQWIEGALPEDKVLIVNFLELVQPEANGMVNLSSLLLAVQGATPDSMED